MKTIFVAKAASRDFDFGSPDCFDKNNKDAILWITERSTEEVNDMRENIMKQIEIVAEEFWANGACQKWFDDAGADESSARCHALRG